MGYCIGGGPFLSRKLVILEFNSEVCGEPLVAPEWLPTHLRVELLHVQLRGGWGAFGELLAPLALHAPGRELVSSSSVGSA